MTILLEIKNTSNKSALILVDSENEAVEFAIKLGISKKSSSVRVLTPKLNKYTEREKQNLNLLSCRNAKGVILKDFQEKFKDYNGKEVSIDKVIDYDGAFTVYPV